jgi:hypothetical protein
MFMVFQWFPPVYAYDNFGGIIMLLLFCFLPHFPFIVTFQAQTGIKIKDRNYGNG